MKNLLLAAALLVSYAQILAQGSNNCLSFNGQSNYISADNLLANLSFSEMTVTVWAKPTGPNDNNGAIFAFNELSSEYTNNVNLLYFKSDHFEYFDKGPNNFNIPTSGYFPPGNWYHIALVIDQNLNGKVYINGIERLVFTAFELPQAGDRFSIGQEWDAYDLSGFYQGNVDELRIWNKALSTQQIREEMCKTISPSAQGLVAYYGFNETSGITLADNTTNGYNGTLVNFNSDDWKLSGAPIGDDSKLLYTNDWANETLTYSSGQEKYLTINNIINAPEGMHIYYVNSSPNSTQGVDNQVVAEYFGVFGTTLDAQYSIEYGFNGYGFDCFECDKAATLYSRNDNAVQLWTDIQPSVDFTGCKAVKTGESQNGLSAREEYIVGKSSQSAIFDALPNNLEICEGTPKTLMVELPNAESYLWSDGSTSPTINISTNGQYWIEVQLFGGCSITDTMTVSSISAPLPFSLSSNDTICLGDTLILKAPAQLGSATYLWQNGSSTSTYPVTESETVSLTISNICGQASASTFVTFDDCSQIFVPNVFSPNSDGINDVFNVEVEDNREVTILSMKVFDRWGEMVFNKSNFSSLENNLGWDGTFKNKPMLSDVFVYLIKVKTKDGRTIDFKGDLTLLR